MGIVNEREFIDARYDDLARYGLSIIPYETLVKLMRLNGAQMRNRMSSVRGGKSPIRLKSVVTFSDNGPTMIGRIYRTTKKGAASNDVRSFYIVEKIRAKGRKTATARVSTEKAREWIDLVMGIDEPINDDDAITAVIAISEVMKERPGANIWSGLIGGVFLAAVMDRQVNVEFIKGKIINILGFA